jgi:hypothetical protein
VVLQGAVASAVLMVDTTRCHACRTVYTIIGKHGVDDGVYSSTSLGEAGTYFVIGVSSCAQ